MDKETTRDFKKEIAERLEKKFPAFESEWKKIVHSLGHQFVNSFKDKFKDEQGYFKEVSQFKLVIVIDNNFIFGQIKGLLKKKETVENTFLCKLAKSSLSEVYAPPKIEEEVYRIIEREISKDEIPAVKILTEKLLGLVKVKEAFWVDDWKKAHRTIGHIDADDTPYFALAFSLKSHGIISFDKHFLEQGDIKIWNIETTGRIISNYNEGFMSFCCMGGIWEIAKMIYHLIVMVFKFIGELFMEILQALILLGCGIVNMLSKVPYQIYLIILGSLLIGLAVSEEVRSKCEKLLTHLGDGLVNILEIIGEIIQKIVEFLQGAWEAFKPYGITTLEITGYLLMNYQIMVEEVEKLEKEKPQ